MNMEQAPEVLAEVLVDLRQGKMMTLKELVEGWHQHVGRLYQERHAHFADKQTWGGHDFVAALHLRSLIAEATDQVSGSALNVTVELVSADDELFKSFTQPDTGGMIERFSSDHFSDTEWWWQRIPISGPVREEFDDFDRPH